MHFEQADDPVVEATDQVGLAFHLDNRGIAARRLALEGLHFGQLGELAAACSILLGCIVDELARRQNSDFAIHFIVRVHGTRGQQTLRALLVAEFLQRMHHSAVCRESHCLCRILARLARLRDAFDHIVSISLFIK